MKLTKDDIENFYRGNSAESLVSSQVFFHGFEAHKYNPDFGVDLLVTNQARQKFLFEDQKEFNIQVKSSLVVRNKALISISKHDFLNLQLHNNPIIVACLFIPLFIGRPSERNSEDPYAQTLHDMDAWLENSWREQNFHAQFDTPRSVNKSKYISNRVAANNLELDGYRAETFWLNMNQFNKGIDDGIISESFSGGEKKYFINIEKEENEPWYFKSNKGFEYYPHPEITHLSYLLIERHGYGIGMEEFASTI